MLSPNSNRNLELIEKLVGICLLENKLNKKFELKSLNGDDCIRVLKYLDLKKLFAFKADKLGTGFGLGAATGFVDFGIVSGYEHLVCSCLKKSLNWMYFLHFSHFSVLDP